MKNLFVGLVLGIFLGGGIAYFVMNSMQHNAHDDGYNAGLKDGNAAGVTEGIAKGKAQVFAEQKRQQDSTAIAAQKKNEQEKTAHKYRKPEPVQNWRVVDGKIEEPIK